MDKSFALQKIAPQKFYSGLVTYVTILAVLAKIFNPGLFIFYFFIWLPYIVMFWLAGQKIAKRKSLARNKRTKKIFYTYLCTFLFSFLLLPDSPKLFDEDGPSWIFFGIITNTHPLYSLSFLSLPFVFITIILIYILLRDTEEASDKK